MYSANMAGCFGRSDVSETDGCVGGCLGGNGGSLGVCWEEKSVNIKRELQGPRGKAGEFSSDMLD